MQDLKLIFDKEKVIAERAGIFLSDLLGSSYPVASAIRDLIWSGMMYGRYSNEEFGEGSFENEEELISYANLKFFNVLSSTNTLGNFVKEIFSESVALQRKLNGKM